MSVDTFHRMQLDHHSVFSVQSLVASHTLTHSTQTVTNCPSSTDRKLTHALAIQIDWLIGV